MVFEASGSPSVVPGLAALATWELVRNAKSFILPLMRAESLVETLGISVITNNPEDSRES